MRFIKLIVPAVLIAMLALFAPRAGAQTMGEYAPTTAGVGGAGGSMGTSVSPSSIGSDDVGGGSRTWGASSLGASFDERAGAASASGAGGDFDSRAGSSAGGSTAESRWPESKLGGGDTSGRFGDSSGRFPSSDRFTEHGEMSSSSDRFPASSFNDNKMGLDTSYNAINSHL